MAQENSFDIVSPLEVQEVDNAIHQVRKEVGQRFDFKGTDCRVERDGLVLILHADDEFKLRALVEILEERLVRRKVSLKALTYGPVERAAGGAVRQRVDLRQGIPPEKAREIVKVVRGSGLKVQAQIQEDQVRVLGRSRDDLQKVIALLREKDFGVDLQFQNYR